MTEANKKIYMWISVVVSLIIIGFIWLSSISYNLSTSASHFIKAKDKGIEKVNSFKEDFTENINDFNQVLERYSPTSTINNVTSTNE